MLFDVEEDADSCVIVIAPTDVSARLARSAGDLSVIAFRSVDDFERWRRTDASRSATIDQDVLTALLEIGFTFDNLSARLRPIIELLLHRRRVPLLGDFKQSWLSRRSLYRIWGAELREGPSSFLRRVRVVHAERLIRDGASPKEAALRAGFASVDHLRRLRAQRRRHS